MYSNDEQVKHNIYNVSEFILNNVRSSDSLVINGKGLAMAEQCPAMAEGEKTRLSSDCGDLAMAEGEKTRAFGDGGGRENMSIWQWWRFGDGGGRENTSIWLGGVTPHKK